MKPSRQRSFHLPGFLALALCALTCSPALLADLNTGLVAWYPFDGNASDMSGNGHHGTVDGATLSADRFGMASSSYDFDGTNDRIKIGDAALNEANAFTISMWVKLDAGKNYHCILSGAKSSTDNNEFLVESSSSVFQLTLKSETVTGSALSTTSWPDTWKQLVFSRASTTASVNVSLDGALAQSYTAIAGASTIANNGLWLGADQDSVGGGWDSSQHFQGSIDEVRIYDRALSAEEVAELYALESSLPAGSVTLDKLAPELSDLLDGNGTIEEALPAGSVIAVKPGDPAPQGYTLFQRNEYNATLTWEEKAPVSVARWAGDGVEVLDGKIYFVGGWYPGPSIAERYDPATNQWETLNSLSVPRAGLAAAVLNGKLYAIGGEGLSSVEIYDPQTGQWSAGPALPSEVNCGTAITVGGKILLVGGRNSADQLINQVLEFDPATNQWTQKAAMPTARYGHKLVLFDGKLWAIGGIDDSYNNKVEIYDVVNNTWTTGPSLSIARYYPSAWVANDRIHVAGGQSGGTKINSIEIYSPDTNQWAAVGSLPDPNYTADTAIINGKVYLIAGHTGSSYTNKVFAADLPPPAMDLYFKDGNATAEAATSPSLDGNLSITLNMLAPDALAKLDVNQTHAQSAGSVIAVPKDAAPPAGYSLYKRTDRTDTLVWEEKASVSVARLASDGVEALDGKLYFVGGRDGSSDKNIAERYDPATNQWETLNPMSVARRGVSTAVLNGKLYAIGGGGLSSVEIYDPQTGQWSAGPSLPSEVQQAAAITLNGKILLVGGHNGSADLSQVLELDPASNLWQTKTSISSPARSLKLVRFQGKVWAMGGIYASSFSNTMNTVQSYDPETNSWTSEASLSVPRTWPMAWVANDKIYIAGGISQNGSYLSSIEVYDSATSQWTVAGSMPENKYRGDAVVLGGQIYVVAGNDGSGYSAKVFAADVTPPMDLYFRDANATGTVTLDKFAGAVVSKLDGIASALPPLGAVSAIDRHDASPTDHAVLERTDRHATHVWEEKAPVSVARIAFDGVEVLDGKIYFVGGFASAPQDVAERYDPKTNQWETIPSLSVPRSGVACSVLNGKLYAIGGKSSTNTNYRDSVEIFDPATGQWTAGTPLPSPLFNSKAITVNGKIFLVGGQNSSEQSVNQVLEFDPSSNSWIAKAPMSTARHAADLVYYEGRIWAVGGSASPTVESYDPMSDSWRTESSLSGERDGETVWLEGKVIYLAGSWDNWLNTTEAYDPVTETWNLRGSLPVNLGGAGSVVLDGKVFIVAGYTGSSYLNKVFAADLIPHHDLYFRDVNASAPAQPAPNQAPVFSGGTATFTTAENNASATFVVTATDPDANTTLVYAKSGPDADKFTLNATTGELTFNTAPDYEDNASAAGNNAYAVTITVSNGTTSATQSVTINVTDDPADDPVNPSPNPPVDNNNTNPSDDGNTSDPAPTLFRPLPKTLAREELGNGNFRLWGQVLADGGSPVTGVAFELADNMVFRNSTLHPASMLAGSPSFFGEFTLEPGKRYYYRAMATNAMGTTSGSPKRLITPPSQARWWTNAPEISGGWRNSPWLGAFRPYDNGWIYHAKLGWAYAHPDGSGGLWIWFRDHHWTWTRPGVFPYLWKHDLGSWHYLLGTRNGQPVFYDFSSNSVR